MPNVPTIEESVAKILADNGVTYSAAFVPLSVARAAGRDFGNGEPCINWRVTFARGKRSESFDYSQGVGHLPALPPHVFKGCSNFYTRTLHERRAASACETGQVAMRYNGALRAWLGHVPLAPPSAANVLYCLCADAEAIDAGTFAEWCANFGASSDSIAARATYDACLDSALRMRALLGADLLAAIAETVREL